MTNGGVGVVELEEIASRLRASAQDEKVSVAVETSEDEAAFVGTESAYLRVAADLVSMVARRRRGALRARAFGGVQASFATDCRAFDRLCEIVPTSMIVTHGDEDRVAIVRALSS